MNGKEQTKKIQTLVTNDFGITLVLLNRTCSSVVHRVKSSNCFVSRPISLVNLVSAEDEILFFRALLHNIKFSAPGTYLHHNSGYSIHFLSQDIDQFSCWAIKKTKN